MIDFKDIFFSALPMEPFDPPFKEFYKNLFDDHFFKEQSPKDNEIKAPHQAKECKFELPLIDLSRLTQGGIEREDCKREIAEASQKWGFFQIVNHGVSPEILEKMGSEQVKAFKKPFQEKVNGLPELNFPAGSYRWGTPSATCLRQLAWSEAFHVPLTEISTMSVGGVTGLSMTMKEYATIVSKLAEELVEILAEMLGQKSDFFKENCTPSSCYLRMSRYPACPFSPQVFGLMPHTDSDFLTILHQDHIGGLQVLKDRKWINVNPKQETLIVIIGDLFQAWSNGVYKSLDHRVIANKQFERFSIAYFLCPSYETVIESCGKSLVYKRFSFREFRKQVQDDVKRYGHKVGLSRFIL